MKRLIFLPLLLLSLTLGATKLYVATTGNDGTGDGSAGAPYLTIAKGVSEASSGDTVYIVSGTYNINATIDVAVGINIMGEGSTTILSSTASGSHDLYGYSPIFNLESAAEGTSGSQSISNMHMNGNDTIADGGIMIYRRSDVKIHNVSMENFHYYGIRFRGGAIPPVIYATGNEISYCTIHNCGGPNVSFGDIQIGGQDGMLIYNNDIYQPQRPGFNRAGFAIKYLAGGDNHGLKIYGNVIDCEAGDEYDEWHTAIELFGCHGGLEFYDNRIKSGVIDFSDYEGSFGTDDSEGYGYAVKIYDNVIGSDSSPTNETYGITFERQTKGGVYIYNNIIKNVRGGITFVNPDSGVTEDIYIYNNIMHNLGDMSSEKIYASGVIIGKYSGTLTIDINNIYILNNTIVNNGAGLQTSGIRLNGLAGLTYDSIYIRNNIIKGVDDGDGIGIWLNGVIGNTINVENNCVNDCDYDNTVYTSCTISNLKEQNNITNDPEFKSESTWRLKSSSPCIDAGIDVGLDYDYYGHRIPQGSAPDIGATEYGNYVLFYNGKQLY